MMKIDNRARKIFEPAAEQAEVVAGGGEHGIDAVAIAALEIVSAHPMVVLEMADDGLDGGPAAHFAADGFGDLADLALIQTLNRWGWLWPR